MCVHVCAHVCVSLCKRKKKSKAEMDMEEGALGWTGMCAHTSGYLYVGVSICMKSMCGRVRQNSTVEVNNKT